MKNLTTILLIVTTALISSCEKGYLASNEVIVSVSVTEFDELINDKAGVLLDVRTPEEYAEGNIPGSILIDFNNNNFKTNIDVLDKKETVLIYCRSGRRSLAAAEIMKEKGFLKIYNLRDGFNAWKELH